MVFSLLFFFVASVFINLGEVLSEDIDLFQFNQLNIPAVVIEVSHTLDTPSIIQLNRSQILVPQFSCEFDEKAHGIKAFDFFFSINFISAGGQLLPEQIDHFFQLAQDGDCGACFLIAFCHDMNYLELNQNENSFFLEKAFMIAFHGAERGDAVAQCVLALMYRLGKFVNQNFIEATYWYSKAAENRVGFANCAAGCQYYFGEGVQQNFEKAAELFKKGIPSADCHRYFGLLYEWGNGVEKDYNKALEHYFQSAKNDITGMFSVASLMQVAEEMRYNIETIINIFLKIIEKGVRKAMWCLGFIFFQKKFNTLNLEMAFYWFKMAADTKYGPPLDHEENAVYKALTGDSTYQFELGKKILRGIDTLTDPSRGVEWITKASKNGNTSAMIELSHCYFVGYGVQKDHKQALHWLMLAKSYLNKETKLFFDFLCENSIWKNDAALAYKLLLQYSIELINGNSFL
jgi:TPR repeat protein